jgi:hypothetical protein
METPANRRSRSVAGAFLDDHVAILHRFGKTPAGTPLDLDLSPIDQAATVIAHTTLKAHSSRLQQSDRQVVTGIRILDRYLCCPALQAGSDHGIDFPRGKRCGIDADVCYLDHTRTSSTWASETL